MKISGGYKKEKTGGSGGKGRVVLIVVLLIVAILLAGAAAGVLYVNRIDTIFPGVTVDGLEIGGLSLNETAEKLMPG